MPLPTLTVPITVSAVAGSFRMKLPVAAKLPTWPMMFAAVSNTLPPLPVSRSASMVPPASVMLVAPFSSTQFAVSAWVIGMVGSVIPMK